MTIRLPVFIAAFFLAALGLSPAWANPNNNNYAHDPSCPNGEVLSTTTSGQVKCVNPTLGVTVSCPNGQVLQGITQGVPVCVSAPATVKQVVATIASVSENCGYPADPNPPSFNQLQYNTTCASRFCQALFNSQLGIIVENVSGYNIQQPWSSDPNGVVIVECVK
jgi:hypothetical protein